MQAESEDKPNPGGRPTILTDELSAKIVGLIQGFNFREHAAKAAGLEPRTFWVWMRKGKQDPDSVYGKFRQAVLEAEGTAHTDAVAELREMAKTDGDHLRWFLERKFPDCWSRDVKRLRDLEKMVAELLDDKRKREG